MTTSIIKGKEQEDGALFRVFDGGKFFLKKIAFQNYFYVKEDAWEVIEDDGILNEFKFCIDSVEEYGQFRKIILKNNFKRKQLREHIESYGFTCYEADIPAFKRIMTDKIEKVHCRDIPHLFYDIETDDRGGLNTDDMGRIMSSGARILSWSVTHMDGTTVAFALGSETDDSEKELLIRLMEEFHKVGIVVAHNGDLFDWPYIQQRCEVLGVPNAGILNFTNNLDFLLLFKKYYGESLPSYSLNYLAKTLLTKEKIDQEKGNGAIYYTWKNNRGQLLEYNKMDTILLWEINNLRRIRFVELAKRVADRACCFADDVVWNSRSVDYMLLKEYHKRNIVCASKPNQRERAMRDENDSISGGFTRCLKKGFFKTVHGWDFASMYPSVIISWNISPETYIGTVEDRRNITGDYIITPNNFNEEKNEWHFYRLFEKKQGVVPAICSFLTAERKAVRAEQKKYDKDSEEWFNLDLEQLATKILNNSVYGCISSIDTRYYIFDCGDAVTTSCQAMIKECYKFLTSYGCDVIGGDTDSTFVVMPDGLDYNVVDQNLIRDIDAWMKQWGMDKHVISFLHEKVMFNMLFVMKKNYAYVTDKGKLKIKGLECKKTDSNPLGGSIQYKFLEAVCFDKYNSDEFKAIVSYECDRVLGGKLPKEELTMIKSLSKLPKEYNGNVIDSKTGLPKVKKDGTYQKKSVPAHVKIAQRMIDSGREVFAGTKIPYIVVGQNPIQAVLPEEAEGYDTQYYWKRAIKPLMKVAYAYHGRLPDWGWNIKMSKAELEKMDNEGEDDTAEIQRAQYSG
jgi:DNA polymerase I